MLTHLRIKNFKAWEDTGPIRLAPITVFFGANSSGKSSLLQFLLMLRQTVAIQDRRRVLDFGGDYRTVDLGSFGDAVFSHDTDRDIEFELAFARPQFEYLNFPPDERISRFEFSASAGWHGAPPKLVLKRMEYCIPRVSHGRECIGMRLQSGAEGKYELRRSPEAATIRPPVISAPVKFYGFPSLTKAAPDLDFAPDLVLAFEREFRQMHYLGPIREPARRSYRWSYEEPEDVGTSGESAVQALLCGRDRHIGSGRVLEYRRLDMLVEDWMQRFGLVAGLETQSGSKRDEFEVLVSSPGTGDVVSLPDVGFGVSQVLPVVVECFYVPHESTLLVEQPELHLHPSVQGQLADLFIYAIEAREENRDRDLQIIVESHSEHLLHRLQRRIAEGDISARNVALYFCERGPEGSKIRPLEVDEEGNIKNWPKDFFGDEMADLIAMTEAAMRRKGIQ